MTGRALAVVAAVVVATGGVSAQSTSAPVDLSGTWALDVHLSDHPEQIARAIAVDTGTYTPTWFSRGRDGGDGSRGRGGDGQDRLRGSGRDTRDREPAADRLSTEERAILDALTHLIQFPPTVLTIAQADGTLTLTGDQRAPETLRTDGSAEEQTLDAGKVTRRAAWVGPQLRVAYTVGSLGQLTYTYFRVPTTGQLLIRINIERVQDAPGPFDIKLVYNHK